MKILYYFVYGLVWAFSLLPFCVLYILSDILFILIYKIARYRRRVIRRNLINSFPDKSKREIRRIERKFYRYFCDYLVESLKTMTMSEKQFRKRMIYKNPELVLPYLENGKNLFVYLSHYGNWEWVSYGFNAATPDKDFVMYPVYNPISNKIFDDLFLKLRSTKRIVPITQRLIMRTVVKLTKEKKGGIFPFIADQSPAPENIYYWTNFLNQETAPILGPEKIAKLADSPVVFIDIARVKRGYYTAEFILMTEHSKEMPEFELSEMYMHLLEKRIQKAPYYWLWTHRRWKYAPDNERVLKYVKLQNKEMVFNTSKKE